MATLNIGATNADDAFYRYKMPKLQAKVEGRGNGIKTNIVNNVDIARALGRSPEYTLKFFGCELGAQTNYDSKTGISILNGAHDAKKLQDLLEGFIKRFVQCYNCGNPETVIKIKKEFIQLKCKACGFVSDVDMRHKLTTFIIKNPPDNKLSKEEARLKHVEDERLKGTGPEKEKKDKDKKEKKDKDKKDKKEKKKKGEDAGDGEAVDAEASSLTVDNSACVQGDDSASEEDEGVVWMTDTSAEAVRLRAEEQLTAATAAMVTQGNIEAERLENERKAAEQAAEEAELLRQEEEAAKAKAAEDARLAAEDARLAAEAAAKLALEGDANVVALRKAIADGADVPSLAAQLKGMTVEGGLAGKMRVLQEAVFNSSEKLSTLLTKHKALFLAHARDTAGQLAQLVALEHYLVVTAPERTKEAALVLKTMYDLDLADEEVILAWSGKQDAGKLLGVPLEGALAVRKVAAPLVQWLKDNESDDEEDDEEEEDEE